jgi:hypothetical protein
MASSMGWYWSAPDKNRSSTVTLYLSTEVKTGLVAGVDCPAARGPLR